MLVHSIFNSIDGEVNLFGQGRFTTFIRLQGCNLKCAWPCDTPQAQEKEASIAKNMTPNEIVKYVQATGYNKITITGGEPLEQRKELIRLLNLFNKTCKYIISVETNGSKSLSNIVNKASWVVDYKLPSSGMNNAMNYETFEELTSYDVVKFVVANKDDFICAIKFLIDIWPADGWIDDYPAFAFSPVFKKIAPATLYKWIAETGLPKTHKIALNIQLHKIIGLP